MTQDNEEGFTTGTIAPLRAVAGITEIPPEPVEIISNGTIKRVALPPDWKLEEKKDDESQLPAPLRKKGSVCMDDLDSFIDYVNRHSVEESTTIYCEADYTISNVSFLSLINDHQEFTNGQQWRDFKVNYKPKFSEEWKRWTGMNEEVFTQTQFAKFLEDNMGDIPTVEGMPTSNELLQMALNFEANQEMRFKSATRLQSGGVQISFVQDDDNQTIQKMNMFNKISIGIPVFWNSQPYRIDAKLRYRVRDGKVTFWYELIREDKVLEDATKTMIEEIKDKTQAPFFFGSP